MLRRWIPVIGVPALVAAMLLLTAESASGGIRDRLRARLGYSDAPVYYENVTMVSADGSRVVVADQTTYPMRTSRLFARRWNQQAYMVERTAPTTSTEPGTMRRSNYPPDSTTVTAPVEPGRRGVLERLRGRRGVTNGPTYYVTSSTAEPVYGRRPSRLFGRRLGRPVYVATRTTASSGTESGTTRMSLYPPDSSGRQPAVINVKVPGNAEIHFDGHKMNLTGTTRQFVSPLLEKDVTYTYEIKAKWMEKGSEVKRTRKVDIRAGKDVEVDFLKPTPEEEKDK